MILKIHTAVGTRIKGIIISFVHNILYVSNLYCEYAQNKQYFYSIRKSQILNVFKEYKNAVYAILIIILCNSNSIICRRTGLLLYEVLSPRYRMTFNDI